MSHSFTWDDCVRLTTDLRTFREWKNEARLSGLRDTSGTESYESLGVQRLEAWIKKIVIALSSKNGMNPW